MPWAVHLGKKYALPGAEFQFSMYNLQGFACSEQHGFEMGISIIVYAGRACARLQEEQVCPADSEYLP